MDCAVAWGHAVGLERVAQTMATVGLSVAALGFVPLVGSAVISALTDFERGNIAFLVGALTVVSGIAIGLGSFALHLWSCTL